MIDPQFDAAAAAITAALFLYTVVIGPLLARRSHRDLAANRARNPGYFARWLWRITFFKWGWCAATAAAVVVASGLTWRDIGVAWPHGGSADLAVGLAVVGLLAVVGSFAAAHLNPGMRRPAPAYLAARLPHTRTEQRAAYGAAVTAGIGEEVLFRGLFVAAGVWVGLPLWASAAFVLVLFVGVHVVVDRRHLAGPAVGGTMVTVLYLAGGGSLLLPVLFHVTADVVSFRAPQPIAPPEPRPAETG